MEILSYALSVLGLGCLLLASVTKGERMRRILFLIFMANILIPLSYIIGGEGINAAASGFVGSVMAIVNYFFQSKKKPIPKWLLLIYMLIFVVLNIAISGGISLPCVLVILGALTFVMCIAQGSGIPYRLWSIANSVIYCVYDVVIGSYNALITHGALLLFAIGGLLFVDFRVFRRK